MSGKKRAAVLVSGRGSNMVALVEAASAPAYPAEIALVVSNVAGAPALARAVAAGIATTTIPSAGRGKPAFESELTTALEDARIDIICLAGFMRVLSPDFVARWSGRLINIHPSLLPEFPGLDTHARALAAGARRHGCTVHFVSAEVDAGPVIAQAAIEVRAGDTAETLAGRVLAEEHRLYPLALALIAGAPAAGAT
jgi:formyltetrahydrofolate-dependent phosphoribosylglycinamide formyltransferase